MNKNAAQLPSSGNDFWNSASDRALDIGSPPSRPRQSALSVMARYNKFDDGSEHDWGIFIFAGFAFEWRIEYRGKDGAGVSPDPADPEQTVRVLTDHVIDDVLV